MSLASTASSQNRNSPKTFFILFFAPVSRIKRRKKGQIPADLT
jgi:hypothetical protein